MLLRSLRVGLHARGTTMWWKCWNFWSQSPASREGRSARGWVESSKANDLNPASVMGHPLTTPPTMGFGKLGWWTYRGTLKVACQQRVCGSSVLLPVLKLCSEYGALDNKLAIVSQLFSWVVWAILENDWTWEWSCRCPQFVPDWSDINVVTWDLWLVTSN